MPQTDLLELEPITRSKDIEHRREVQREKIANRSAQQRGAIGYTNRIMLQATFPLRNSELRYHKAVNGGLTVEMAATGDGLPYGSYPRLLMCWLTQAAQENALRFDENDPNRLRITFGNNVARFMAQLGIDARYGKGSNTDRMVDQLRRLFKTTLTVTQVSYDEKDKVRGERATNVTVGRAWEMYWTDRDEQDMLLESSVVLQEDFFNLLVDRPVPIDMDILRHVKNSPLAIDLYLWLTYRYSYLRTPTTVSVPQLMLQFGTGYDHESSADRRDFMVKFKRAWGKVQEVWPDARMGILSKGQGVILHPTKPSVGRRPARPKR